MKLYVLFLQNAFEFSDHYSGRLYVKFAAKLAGIFREARFGFIESCPRKIDYIAGCKPTICRTQKRNDFLRIVKRIIFRDVRSEYELVNALDKRR